MGMWSTFKEEYKSEMKKQKEKDRIKAEQKREQEENMSTSDKGKNDLISAAKWYAAFKWGIPALLVIGFVVFVFFVWILNQFGIYL